MTTWAREWVLFAVCLGIGGHLALGFVLHAPERWPRNQAGFYGVLSGLAVYATVQAVRWIWTHVRVKQSCD